MKFFMIWEVAFKAIQKNLRRSLLTMLGLVIGTAAVITIVSVGRGYEKDQIEKLLPVSDGDTIQTTISFTPADNSVKESNLSYFSLQDINRVKEINGVVNATFQENKNEAVFESQTISYRDFAQANRIKLIPAIGREVREGRGLNETDQVNKNKVVVLSSVLAEQITEGDFSLLGETIVIGSEPFLIVGIYEGTFMETGSLEMPEATYNYYWQTKKKKNLTVTLSNQVSIAETGQKIASMLNKSGSVKSLGHYENSSSASMVDSLSSMFQSLTILISFIGGISLFISGVGVMNMIYTSVSERKKEIGIRRAMGANARTIQLQFLLEGITLTLFGGIIGYVLGLIFAKIISILMGFSFKPDFFTAALAVGISVGVGLIFSYFPAKTATAKDIVQLVR